MDNRKANYLLETFAIERAILFWSGLYPVTNVGITKFQRLKLTIHHISLVFSWMNALWMYFSMFVFILLEHKDVPKIAGTLLFITTQSAYLFKMFILTFYKKKMVGIENMLLDNAAFLVNNDFKQHVKSSRTFLNLYCLSACISVTSYFTVPIFDKGDIKQQVVPVYTLWDIHKSNVNYYSQYLLQCISITNCALNNTEIDTLFAMLATVVSGQFRILANNLKNMDYQKGLLDVKMAFKRNIILHTEILRLIAMVEDMFSALILVQCMATIFVICFTAYEMSMISPASSEFLHLVFYLACMLEQLAVYCFYGHNVMADSETLGDALYLSQWHESDLSIRKYIIIVMERVKRPVQLTAGKFFPLTLLTFMKILKSSYSFFAFLQRPTNDD